jgi:hypothetical protein
MDVEKKKFTAFLENNFKIHWKKVCKRKKLLFTDRQTDWLSDTKYKGPFQLDWVQKKNWWVCLMSLVALEFAVNQWTFASKSVNLSWTHQKKVLQTKTEEKIQMIF